MIEQKPTKLRLTLVSSALAATALAAGDKAFVAAGDAIDMWGEFNGAASAPVAR